MTQMTSDLYKAILSMDAYNRGYGASINFGSAQNNSEALNGVTSIGNSTVYRSLGDTAAQSIGYYSIAYQLKDANGNVIDTIISYRGTDSLLGDFEHLFMNGDSRNGYSIAAGDGRDSPQGNMAIQFYNDIIDEVYGVAADPHSANMHVSLTGHSLGGGLAGYVADLYSQRGTIFDNMAFEDAADLEYTSATLDLLSSEQKEMIYGGATPWENYWSGLHGYQVTGQFLGANIIYQNTPVTELDMGPNVNLGFGYDGFDAHSMSTLAILLYANETMPAVANWKATAKYFWPVLYDSEFAGQIGFNDTVYLAGKDHDKGDYSSILRQLLAYSIIDEGTRLYGDTAIRALYDDANDFGKALAFKDVQDLYGHTVLNSALTTYATFIAESFVQYAGQLALSKTLYSDNPTATQGIITYTLEKGIGNWADYYSNQALEINFSADKWADPNGMMPNMVARDHLVSAILNDMEASSPVSVLGKMSEIWGDNVFFDRVIFSILKDFNYSTTSLFVADREGGQTNLFVTSDTTAGETVYGTSQNDLFYGRNLVGFQGNFVASLGNDLYFGGQANNILSYKDMFEGIIIDDANSTINFLATENHKVDYFSGIDEITGTSFNDYFSVASGSSSTSFDGSGGYDTFDLSTRSSGVTIEYSHDYNFFSQGGSFTWHSDSDAGGFRNIENIILSSSNDLIDSAFWSSSYSSYIPFVSINAGNGVDTFKGGGNAVMNEAGVLVLENAEISNAEIFHLLNVVIFQLGHTYVGGNGSIYSNALDYSGYDKALTFNISVEHFSGSVTDGISTDYIVFEENTGGFQKIIGTNYGDTFNLISTDLQPPPSRTILSGLGDDTLFLSTFASLSEYIYTGGDDRIVGHYAPLKITLASYITIDDLSYADNILFINNYGSITFDPGTFYRISFWNGDFYSAGNIVHSEAAPRTDFDTPNDDIIDINNMYLGNGSFYGGNGNDIIYGHDAIGGEGDDTLIARVYGRVDNLSPDGWGSFFEGGAGNDHIYGFDGITSVDGIYGGDGNDIIFAYGGYDIIFGGRGDDYIDGGYGNDMITGGLGNDKIVGGDDDDALYANEGDDEITGGTGQDYIYGGDGNDTYYFSNGDGTDIIYDGGAAYTDIIRFDASVDASTIRFLNIGDGYLRLSYGESDLILVANQFSNNYYISSPIAGAYNPQDGIDMVILADGTTYDLRGTITFTGTVNGDVIYGTNNSDIIIGLGGFDTIYGFGGNDRYVYSGGTSSIAETSGIDRVELSSAVSINDARIDGNVLSFDSADDKITFNNISLIEIFSFSGHPDMTLSQLLIYINNYSNGIKFITSSDSESFAGTWALDTVDYSLSNAAVSVDISSGHGTGGYAEGDTYSSIENIVGSAYADILIGDSNRNTIDGGSGNDQIIGGFGRDTLYGGSGNDILIGGAGDDLLQGGDGIDTADYSDAISSVFINLNFSGAQYAWGAGADTLVSIENIIGSAFDDNLTGDANANAIFGGLGHDSIEGGLGDDILDGQDGYDTISYLTASAGVVVNLSISTSQNTISAGVDTINGFEVLIGSSYNDILTGDNGNNFIQGGEGNDVIKGMSGDDVIDGGLGDDILDGEEGYDTIYYSSAFGGVVVNLGFTFSQNTISAGVDTIVGFENLVGSSYNDKLIGDNNSNYISGENGNDIIEGMGGDDILLGGLGLDTLSYESSANGVNLALYMGYTDNASTGLDIFYDFENLTGSSHDDVLTGDWNSNIISGGKGNDTLDGAGGVDFLYGGLGDDTYIYSGVENIILETGNGLDRVVVVPYFNIDDIRLNGNVLSFENSPYKITFGDINLIEIFSFNGQPDMTLAELKDHASLWSGGSYSANEWSETFIGIGSSDQVDYSSSTSSITVDISNNTGSGGYAEADNYFSIENVIGSTYGDTITGDVGDNIINGLNGDDTLSGNTGNDVLIGGEGNDTYLYNLGDGFDSIIDTSGIDRVIIGSDYMSSDLTTRFLGNDLILSLQGIDVIRIESQATNSTVETVEFSDGTIANLPAIPEIIEGTTGNDMLTGGENNNIIMGYGGNDTLIGNGGDDFLQGGLWEDVLSGGLGADIFKFAPDDLDASFDYISDFSASQGDKIDVKDLLVGYDEVTSAIADFIEFTTVGSNTIVKVDRDGASTGYSWQQVAQLDSVTGLTDEATLKANGNLIVA